jgi:hypothetical protein
MATDDVPEVTGKEVVAREHKHNVHDQVQYQEHSLQSWRDSTPSNRDLTVLAKCCREKQMLSDSLTHTICLRSILVRAMLSCSNEFYAPIDQTDDDNQPPKPINSPAVMCRLYPLDDSIVVATHTKSKANPLFLK